MKDANELEEYLNKFHVGKNPHMPETLWNKTLREPMCNQAFLCIAKDYFLCIITHQTALDYLKRLCDCVSPEYVTQRDKLISECRAMLGHLSK